MSHGCFVCKATQRFAECSTSTGLERDGAIMCMGIATGLYRSAGNVAQHLELCPTHIELVEIAMNANEPSAVSLTG